MNISNVLQFKVSLKDIEPPIWRRIQVPQNYSFWDLHVAIQDAMGWFDSHLHLFSILNPETNKYDDIGIPDPDAFIGDPVFLPGWELPISRYFNNPGVKSKYEYDFGDEWIHDVVLEIIEPKLTHVKYPICIEGKRACPPEDCGGPDGYLDLLEILKNPKDKEHESIMEWLGVHFDPESFDPKDVKFDNPKKRWQHAFGNL